MGKFRFALAAGVFLALALCGCSQSDVQDSSGAFTINAESYQDAMNIVQSADVYCQNSDGSGCSPSVGMYVAISPNNNVMQCTAFLVSPRLAITNSHCIPSDLKTSGSSCSGRIWVDFPGLNGGQQTNVSCDQVLFASSIPDPDSGSNEIDPDYAVIELAQAPGNPALSLNRDGFEDQNTYQLVKVDPQSQHAAVGALETTPCTAVHGSLLVKDSSNDESANMTFGDCTVIHGNSGSPLLDGKGNVRGVIQALFDASSLGAIALEMTGPQLDSGVAPLAIGTSFACLDFPSGVSAEAKDPACANVSMSSSSGGQVALPPETLQKDLQAKLRSVSGELDPVFQWTTASYSDGIFALSSDDSRKFITVPKCVKDSASLLKDEALLLGGYSSTASRFMELQVLTEEEGLNKYLAPDGRVDSDVTILGTLTYDPEKLAKNGVTKVTLTVPEGLLEADTPVFSQSIGRCGN